MVDALSLLTLASIGFIASVLFANIYGVIISFSLHVFIVGLFHFMGVALFSIPFEELLVLYFVGIFLWSIIGCYFSILFNMPQLLNADWVTRSFNLKNQQNKISGAMAKTYIWLIIYIFTFIPYELDLGSSFPEPAGGFVTFIVNIIMWVIFYYIYKDEHTLFNLLALGNIKTEDVVLGLTWKLAFIQNIFILIFILFDFLGPDFIADHWYFYITIIMGVISCGLAYVFRIIDSGTKTKK